MPRVSVVLPTYNERENLPILLEELDRHLRDLSYEVIVVDDNSPDGTAEVARRLSSRYPVRVVVRRGKLGLSSAVVRGAREASAPIVIVMDADLQHPPRVARLLALKALEGYDLVVASRYARGGGVENWSILRHAASLGATLLARLLVKGARRVSDPMSGFFAVRRELLLSPKLRPRGFKILLEVLGRSRIRRVAEVPFTFKPRRRGASKLSLGIVVEMIKQLLDLAVSRDP
jgi:dolichol-phosphate mannosyltransferase